MIVLTFDAIGKTAIVLDEGVPRVEFDGLFVVQDGVFVLVFGAISHAAIVEGAGEAVAGLGAPYV